MKNCHLPYVTQEIAPVSEPVTLTEAKLYLRVDGSGEDAVINRLIASARKAAEKYMRRSLITQSWKITYDDYAPSEIQLPRGPIQNISSVKIIGRDASETVISASKYYLNSGREKLVIDTALLGHIVEVIYVAGFGEHNDIPDDIKQGMLIHIAKLYDSRSSDISMPISVRSLYDTYREIML